MHDIDKPVELDAVVTTEEAAKSFRIHLIVFVIVMTALTALNLVDTSVWWVQWPFLGWGLGLTLHGLST